MLHDIDLTKKGEAYVLRHNPTACPEGIEPRLWRKAISQRAETHLALATALLSLLDGIDGDCDLEDNGDAEPSLSGQPVNGQYDLELDNADDEDSDTDEDSDPGELEPDLEPSLGFTEHCNQASRIVEDKRWEFDDLEADYVADAAFGPSNRARVADFEPSAGSASIRTRKGLIIHDPEGIEGGAGGRLPNGDLLDGQDAGLGDDADLFFVGGPTGGPEIALDLLRQYGLLK